MAHQILISKRMPSIAFSLAAMLVGLFMTELAFGQAAPYNPTYPRLAAGQIGGWNTYSEARIQNIAKHDVAVIGLWRSWSGGGYNSATLPGHIKSLNPAIKLAHYTDVIEINSGSDSAYQWVRDKISREKGANGRGDWWLKTANGSYTGTYPGLYRMNHTLNVSRDANGLRLHDWWARYENAPASQVGDWTNGTGKGLSEGAWDAVYSDVQYVNTVGSAGVTADYDNNGVDEGPNSQQVIDWVVGGHVAYRNAWKALQPSWQFWANMAGQMYDSVPIQPGYRQLNEGGWFEGIMGFSWSVESWGGWQAMMAAYRKGMSLLAAPKIGMFHNNLDYGVNVLGFSQYRWNRYGLCSALMDDGYYMVTVSDAYSEQRWYDEFDVNLGYPIDPPQLTAWSNGVYRRLFDNGLVLVNPKGNGTKTVNVGTGWKRFSGQQDSAHNNGQPVTSVTLNERDGIILVPDGVQVPPMPPALQGVT